MLSDKFKEFAKTLFIIDKPMIRWSYFKINLCLFIFGLLVYGIVMLLVNLIEANFPKEIATPLYIFIIGFVIVWVLFITIISFVISTKRFWDIIGNRNYAIIASILFLVIVVFPEKIVHIAGIRFFIYLVLLFTKGKKQESIQKEENKEEVSKEG